MKTNATEEFSKALSLNAGSFEVVLKDNEAERLNKYYELLLVWNERLHLVAPCSPSEFATRHVLESLQLVKHLSANARVADVGSGAGLPIIPALIARPDTEAVLIESSHKKAVFLREALRATKTLEQARVLAERFEDVPTPEVDYVTCRALDRFSQLLPELIDWAPRPSTLLLFGGESLQRQIETSGLDFSVFKIPDSERRWLFVVERDV